MKILRRGLIFLLVVANIALLVFILKGIKEPPQEISADHVTVVETPDQTEAIEHPDFIPEEFVLELPQGENVAVKKRIDSSGFNDVYAAGRAIDGATDGGSYWEGTSDYPNTLTVDLLEPFSIHTVRICLNPLNIWGKRTQTITVNKSSDGINFEELVKLKQYTFDPATGNQIQIEFDETIAQYVQLVITENSGAGGGQVAEFEVYTK